MRLVSFKNPGALRIGLLLISMLVCGLVGLVVGLWNASPEQNAKPVKVVEAPKTLLPVQPPPAPEPPPPPPQKKEQTWDEATDALKLIQIYKDSVLGSWRMENGELLCNRSEAATIEIPFIPPEEYDFQIEFSIDKEGGSVGQIMAANGHQLGWYVGAYLNSYAGLQMIDSHAMPENPTGVKFDRCLQANHRHTSLVEIRKNAVKAYLDGKLISHWESDFKQFTLFDASQLLHKDVLGLWSGDSATTFHSVKIRGVSGKGTRSRLADQPPADF